MKCLRNRLILVTVRETNDLIPFRNSHFLINWEPTLFDTLDTAYRELHGPASIITAFDHESDVATVMLLNKTKGGSINNGWMDRVDPEGAAVPVTPKVEERPDMLTAWLAVAGDHIVQVPAEGDGYQIVYRTQDEFDPQFCTQAPSATSIINLYHEAKDYVVWQSTLGYFQYNELLKAEWCDGRLELTFESVSAPEGYRAESDVGGPVVGRGSVVNFRIVQPNLAISTVDYLIYKDRGTLRAIAMQLANVVGLDVDRDIKIIDIDGVMGSTMVITVPQGLEGTVDGYSEVENQLGVIIEPIDISKKFDVEAGFTVAVSVLSDPGFVECARATTVTPLENLSYCSWLGMIDYGYTRLVDVAVGQDGELKLIFEEREEMPSFTEAEA